MARVINPVEHDYIVLKANFSTCFVFRGGGWPSLWSITPNYTVHVTVPSDKVVQGMVG